MKKIILLASFLHAFFYPSAHGNFGAAISWCKRQGGKMWHVGKVLTHPQGTYIGDWFSHQKGPWNPKADLARVVGLYGVRTPQTYSNFHEMVDALTSGRVEEIVLRSEHEKEYNGPSGILRSYRLSLEQLKIMADEMELSLTPENYDAIESFVLSYFKQLSLEMLRDDYDQIVRTTSYFPESAPLDPDRAVEESRFSYWEYLPGENFTVSQDSGQPSKIHILMAKPPLHMVVENNQVTKISGEREPTPDQVYAAREMAKTYRRVKKIPGFIQDHAPIMEFQRHKNQNYWLQYHRSKNIDTAEFRLDSPPENEAGKGPWMETNFIRGVTTEKGSETSILVPSPALSSKYSSLKQSPLPLAEVLTAKTKRLYVDLTRESKRRSTESGDHIIASNMFKTNTYASISLEQLVGNDIAKILRKEAAQTPEDNFPLEIKVQVISDGNKAYIRWTQLPDIPKIQAITGRQAP